MNEIMEYVPFCDLFLFDLAYFCQGSSFGYFIPSDGQLYKYTIV